MTPNSYNCENTHNCPYILERTVNKQPAWKECLVNVYYSEPFASLLNTAFMITLIASVVAFTKFVLDPIVLYLKG
jgi:hypothetical protein